MSLPARERRRLTGIQAEFDLSDPRLVTLFATFSRLNEEEEMPPLERLRVRTDRLAARGRVIRSSVVGRLRIVIIAPVALLAACVALLVGGWSGGPSACRVKPAVSHALHRYAPSSAQPAIWCRPALLRAEMGAR